MPFAIGGTHLGEHCASGEVRTIRFDAEWVGRVRRDENWCGGDTLLESVESRLLSGSPTPFSVIAGEAIRDLDGRIRPESRFSLRKASSSFCSVTDKR